VLPVFEGGGRGCWVDLSANNLLTPDVVLGAMRAPGAAARLAGVRALHVGYPHLLRGLQGPALLQLLEAAAEAVEAASGEAPIVSLDVNGATLGAAADADGVIGPALGKVDLLHANFEEACHISGRAAGSLAEEAATDGELEALVAPLLEAGVGLVAITLGRAGAYVAFGGEGATRRQGGGAFAAAAAGWRPGECVRLPALPVAGEVNANGAGDAFVAGLLAALLWRGTDGEPLTLEQAARVALGSARQRIDPARRESPESVDALCGENVSQGV